MSQGSCETLLHTVTCKKVEGALIVFCLTELPSLNIKHMFDFL